MSRIKLDNFDEDLAKIKMHLPDYLAEHGMDVRNGGKILCLNPQHDDNSPSMSMFEGKSGEPIAHCFSCGFNADIFAAAHAIEHKPIVGAGFIEDNVQYLAAKYDIELSSRPLTEEEVYEYNIYAAYKMAAEYISNAPFNDLVQSEINNRGWDEKKLRDLQVGTCDDYDKFRSLLKVSGFNARFLDEIDLGNKHIFNPECLIFTTCDDSGRPVGFSARNLKYDGVRDENHRLVNGNKFNNSRTTNVKCNIYRKSERLYLLDRAKRLASSLYIVEGHGDAISMHIHGITNSVAIGSLELSEHHLNTCRRNGVYDVIVCLDGDERGQEKARKLLDEVLQTVHDLRIRFVFLPFDEGSKTDPDSFLREHGVEEFLSLAKIEPFEWRLMEFEKDPDADSETICFSMIPIIMAEPSPIKREGMIRELSESTGFANRIIKEELDKLSSSEEAKVQKRRDAVSDQLMNAVSNKSDTIEILLNRALDSLHDISKDSTGGTLDTPNLVNNILSIKRYEENEELHHTINFGPNLRTNEIALSGDLRQKMMLLGGSANTGCKPDTQTLRSVCV